MCEIILPDKKAHKSRRLTPHRSRRTLQPVQAWAPTRRPVGLAAAAVADTAGRKLS
jgi:hypothetical protein